MPRGGPYRFFFVFLGTGFYSGYCPVAPGTAGTLVGIGLFWCFSKFTLPLYLITILAFIFLSVWIADGAEKIFQKKDAPCIVIDEISGLLITMTLIPWSWPNVGLGFFLFRFFDILKPFPARWVEKKLPGGWGVVLDDIVAGVYANIVLQGVVHWL